jgi:hypothetical protein
VWCMPLLPQHAVLSNMTGNALCNLERQPLRQKRLSQRSNVFCSDQRENHLLCKLPVPKRQWQLSYTFLCPVARAASQLPISGFGGTSRGSHTKVSPTCFVAAQARWQRLEVNAIVDERDRHVSVLCALPTED